MTHKFVHVHASGRYDAPIKQVRASFHEMIFIEKAEIITGTELTDNDHKNIVEKIDGYGKAIGSRTYSDDSYVLWDEKVWKVLHVESFKTTDLQFYNKIGKKRDPAYAKIVVLEHRESRKRLLVTVAHLPSSVQDGNKFVEGGLRVPAWLDGARNWRKRRNLVYKRFNCYAMLVSADWNIDLKARFAQVVIKALQPSMDHVWNLRNLPKIGTHGPRLIDFSLIRGNLGIVKRPEIMLDKRPDIDHKMYKETLRLL